MLRTCFSVLALGAMLSMTVALSTNGESHLPGEALSPSEMASVEGQTCTKDCVYWGKVCGFSCVITWLGGDDCEDIGDCYPIGWYAEKCSVGFTQRHLCDGPNDDPDCDNNFKSIDCGGWSVCLYAEYSCVGGKCTCTGVSGCGGIPYVTECGSHSTCQ